MMKLGWVLVLALGIFAVSSRGSIFPPSPILFLLGSTVHQGPIYSPQLGSTIGLTRMNYNSTLVGWQLENISIFTCGVSSGAMVVNRTKLYTFGLKLLAGIGVDSTSVTLPTMVKDFYPETIVDVKSTYTSQVALLSNGSTYSWGSGDMPRFDGGNSAEYILGQPRDISGSYPLNSLTIERTGTNARFKAIYRDSSIVTWAIGYDDQLYSFGPNTFGTVSNGSSGGTNFEPTMSFPGINETVVRSIRYIGGQHRALALLDDGSWLCWGSPDPYGCGPVRDASVWGQPTRYFNPYPNVTFVKMKAFFDSSAYVLTNASTLWAWGGQAISGAVDSPYCQPDCMIHQVRMPEGRENVKVIDIWGSENNFFIMNEIGEMYDTGTNGPGRNYAWRRVLIGSEVPNGHQIDFTTQVTGRRLAYGWLTKLVNPCPEPRPYFGGDYINCMEGKWRIFNPIIDANFNTSVPVQTYANFTITSPSSMTISNYSNLDDPVITMPGCIEGLDLLQILFNLSNNDLESFEIPTITLFEFDSSCQYSSLPNTSVIHPTSPISVFSNVSRTSNGGKSQFVVSFTKPLDDFQLNSDLTLNGNSPLSIPGNLVVDSPVTIKVPKTGSQTLSVLGCIKGMNLLTIEVSVTEEELKSDQIPPRVVIEMSSSCTIALLPSAKVTQPKLCKKAQAEVVVTPLETRLQLSVLFKISKVSCNTWWIILVSVICGIAGIAVVVTLLIFLNPTLRMKCQPYVLTRQ